jgi:hypothetical protein
MIFSGTYGMQFYINPSVYVFVNLLKILFSAPVLMPRSVVFASLYTCHILLQVRGTCPDDVRAVQVPEVTSSLNSDDVFVLETPSATYLWLGRVCTHCCRYSMFL